MAEIRIERARKRGLGWLWGLLLILVLAAVAWYLWSQGYLGGHAAGRTDSTRPDSTRTGFAPAAPQLYGVAVATPTRFAA
jgi:hypothetical protein